MLGGGAETLGNSRNRPIGLISSGEDETRTWYKSKYIITERDRRDPYVRHGRDLCNDVTSHQEAVHLVF